MTRLALRAIRSYQRHLSPRKGFVCAYRIHTGGEGCSAYGYRVIERHGVRMGIGLLRRRLRACSEQHRLHAPVRSGLVVNRQAGFCDADFDNCDLDCGDLSSAFDAVNDCGACDFDLPDSSKTTETETRKAKKKTRAQQAQSRGVDDLQAGSPPPTPRDTD
jgi:uncharacterized protein